MSTKILTSITLISAPYHLGLRDSNHRNNRVSEGPDYILQSAGLVARLKTYDVPVHQVEIPPVADAFEGEIGRSFEVLRRISNAVTAARNQSSFPIVLAGNCCASVGVAAGLWGSEDLKDAGETALGCVWFDAHDDYNTPDTVLSGYFDSQGIAMMAGECWKALMETIPGFRPTPVKRVVHCGMRDVNQLEKKRVERSEMGVVWGDATKKVDFEEGLRKELRERFGEEKDTPTLVHLDLDCVDTSVGKANAYASPGGLSAEDMADCIEAISERTMPVAFTVASFDPYCDGEGSAQQLAGIAVDAVVKVLGGLRSQGLLRPK